MIILTELRAVDIATALKVVSLVGSTLGEAKSYSKERLEITTIENPNATILVLDFMRILKGVNTRKVIATGEIPFFIQLLLTKN